MNFIKQKAAANTQIKPQEDTEEDWKWHEAHTSESLRF